MCKEPTPTPTTVRSGTKNMKCRPSGRKYGQPCVYALLASTCVTCSTAPPSGRTLYKPLPASGENKIYPAVPQLPPRPECATAIVRAVPPSGAILINLPCAKNPICLLSGDQNG